MFCSQDNKSGSMQGLCLWCDQWLFRKPFLTQLHLLATKPPSRSWWRGVQESHACWVKSPCILQMPSSRLMATGVSGVSHMFPTSSCWIPLSLGINPVVLLTAVQLLFSEPHRHICGVLWTGAAGSTIHLFIRILAHVLKNNLKRKNGLSNAFCFSHQGLSCEGPLLPLVYRIPIWLGTLIYVGCNPEQLIWFILRSFILRNF